MRDISTHRTPVSPALRRVFLGAAALCALWAAITFATGGVEWSTRTFHVTSRDPFRPAVIALVLIVAYWYLARDAVSRAAQRVEEHSRYAPGIAATMAVGVALAAVVFGTRVAGGADTYGYLSQADLWSSSAHVTIDQRSFDPWPYDDMTLSPLGYRPGLRARTIVPTYAPGLPVLMAAADRIHPRARFFVVALSAALAVWLTFRLGLLLFDWLTGLAGAVLLASSPAFLHSSMWPMSDIPATAAWTLALVLTLTRRPAAAGLAGAVAIALRPNLVVLLVPLAVLAVALDPKSGGPRARARSALAIVCSALPVILGLAWLNTVLYGAPWASGYGAATGIYHWLNIWPNALRYGAWMNETQTPFIALGLAALVVPGAISPATLLGRPWVRFALCLFVTLVIVPYLMYERFDEWMYLRFLLPAFPVLLVVAVGCLREMARRYGTTAGLMATGIGIALVFSWEITTAQSHGAFTVEDNERRYTIVAADLEGLVPETGVVLAMQHSGSVRYYAHRMTVRYDWLPPDALEAAVATLTARGAHPYLLIESWEIEKYRARFAERSPRGRLAWPPERAWAFPNGITVQLFDLQPVR